MQEDLPVSDDRFGVAGVQLAWLSPDQQEMELILAAASGAKFVGMDIDWQRIEPEPGHFNWIELDKIVALAEKHNLNLVPMLLYTPRWASSAAFAPLDSHRSPPNRYEDYRNYVYAVVNRYKPFGDSSLTADGYVIKD